MEPLASTATAVVVSTEAELVRRAARGDAGAFEQLVSSRMDVSFRTARAILGSEADARDAVQNAIISAWRDLPRLRDVESFDAWIRRIVVNACRAMIRGRRHVREIALDGAFERGDGAPTISDQVGDTDLLARAFERLGADKRAILVLHYLNHEPVAVIADALGVPIGTVKWRLSEARGALHRALAAEGEARS